MIVLTFAEALRWTERLACIASALSALELLHVRRALSDQGVFRWPNIRRELAGAPALLRALLDALLAYRPFVGLLSLQLAIALLGLFVEHQAISAFLFGASLLVCVRFRGSYNGGSDAMMLCVLLGVAAARLFQAPALRTAALAYVAAQLVLSYCVAGFAKLGQRSWRDGRALRELLQLPAYGAPRAAAELVSRRGVARLGAWTVLALECAAPLALTGPRACAIFLSLALTFHLANVALLGLNRFFWAWLPAYPALLYFSQHR
jgi:hypothetical protein